MSDKVLGLLWKPLRKEQYNHTFTGLHTEAGVFYIPPLNLRMQIFLFSNIHFITKRISGFN